MAFTQRVGQQRYGLRVKYQQLGQVVRVFVELGKFPSDAAKRVVVVEIEPVGSGEDQAASPKAPPAIDLINVDTSVSASTGTRPAKDGALSDDWRKYCVQYRPDLEPETVAENFRDY